MTDKIRNFRDGCLSDYVAWVESENAIQSTPREYPSAPLWGLEPALSWVVNEGREQEISVIPIEIRLGGALLYGGPLADAANKLLAVLRDKKLPAWRVNGDVSSEIDPIIWRSAASFKVIGDFKDCVVDAATLKSLFPAKRGRPRSTQATQDELDTLEQWITDRLAADPDLAARDAEKAYAEAFGDAALSRDKYFRPKFKEMAAEN